MPESLSFLGLLASGLYALVVLACVVGTTTAIGKRQPGWHRNVWIVLAVLFVALILMRGLGIEDWLRAALREGLRSEGEYEGRRDLQSLIVAGVLALVGVIGGWWFFRPPATPELPGPAETPVASPVAEPAAPANHWPMDTLALPCRMVRLALSR